MVDRRFVTATTKERDYYNLSQKPHFLNSNFADSSAHEKCHKSRDGSIQDEFPINGKEDKSEKTSKRRSSWGLHRRRTYTDCLYCVSARKSHHLNFDGSSSNYNRVKAMKLRSRIAT